jgi:D-alanine-D-alanine ligase
MALGCRDVARIDFRMDERGRIFFLECNPLPGLTPGWSDLVLIAQGSGIDYRNLIGEILSGAIRRYKEREQRKVAVGGNGITVKAALEEKVVQTSEPRPEVRPA